MYGNFTQWKLIVTTAKFQALKEFWNEKIFKNFSNTGGIRKLKLSFWGIFIIVEFGKIFCLLTGFLFCRILKAFDKWWLLTGFNRSKIVMIILLELFILFCPNYQGTSGLDQKIYYYSRFDPSIQERAPQYQFFFNSIAEELQVLWKDVRLESNF